MSGANAVVPRYGRLLDIRRAAEYLGITEEQLRREIRARRIRVLRRGRAIGIYEAWCDQYVEAQTTAPAASVRGFAPSIAQSVDRPLGIQDLLPPKRLIRVR
jgi:excisionase family DNA binding protein